MKPDLNLPDTPSSSTSVLVLVIFCQVSKIKKIYREINGDNLKWLLCFQMDVARSNSDMISNMQPLCYAHAKIIYTMTKAIDHVVI
jgi:hypothetical protein